MEVDLCICTNDPPKINLNNILKYVKPRKIIVEMSKPLSVARTKAIEKVGSEWFLFLDDDVILFNDILKEFEAYVTNSVGALEGSPYLKGLGKKFDESINRHGYRSSGSLKKGERGYTVVTLVRTALVKDWSPPHLTTWEDYSLTQHILKKGFKWIRIPVSAFHISSWEKIRKNIFWAIDGWRAYHTVKEEMKLLIQLIYVPFTNFLQIRNMQHFLYHIYCNFWYFLAIVFTERRRLEKPWKT